MAEILNTVANITSNDVVQAKLKNYGLRAMKVAWEDTSRHTNSCWGSNITALKKYSKCMHSHTFTIFFVVLFRISYEKFFSLREKNARENICKCMRMHTFTYIFVART